MPSRGIRFFPPGDCGSGAFTDTLFYSLTVFAILGPNRRAGFREATLLLGSSSWRVNWFPKLFLGGQSLNYWTCG